MKITATLITALILLLIISQSFIHVTTGTRAKATFKENEILLKRMAMGAKDYLNDTGQWPKSVSDLMHAPNDENWQGPYVKAKDVLDPWDRPYVFKAHAKNNSFSVCTLGSDHQPGGEQLASDVTLLYQNDQLTYHYRRFC